MSTSQTAAPPKPIPVPFGDKYASSAMKQSQRDKLRQSLVQRRRSLTPQEHHFLEQLIVHGSESEIAAAHSTLMNEQLFFDNVTKSTRAMEHRESTVSSLTSNSVLSESSSGESFLQETPSDESFARGSDRRQELIEERRKNPCMIWKAHENGLSLSCSKSRRSLLAKQLSQRNLLIKQASQRNLMAKLQTTRTQRSNSLPFLRCGALVPDTRDDSEESDSITVKAEGAGASFKTRRVSWGMLPTSSQNSREERHRSCSLPSTTPWNLSEQVAAEVVENQRRKTSIQPGNLCRSNDAVLDVIEKIYRTSHVMHVDNVASPSSKNKKSSPIRSDSQASYPSLHHGHPVRSQSFRSDVVSDVLEEDRSGKSDCAPQTCEKSSFQINQKLPLLRSDSTMSYPSLHHGDPVRSQSFRSEAALDVLEENFDENKISDSLNSRLRCSPNSSPKNQKTPRPRTDSQASYPSLHHGHTVLSQSERSDAIFDILESECVESSSEDSLPMGDVLKEIVYKEPEETRTRPVLARMASRNGYSGEGFELEDLSFDSSKEEEDYTTDMETDSDNPASKIWRCNRKESLQRSSKKFLRPILMRRASVNFYKGEGVEVADWETEIPVLRRDGSSFLEEEIDVPAKSYSFDETVSFNRVSKLFERHIERSLSDDALLRHEEADKGFLWHMEEYHHYNSWLIMEEEVSYFGERLPFKILGTSADDVECHPHVLSPPLMESLQQHFPYSRRGENLWLKYSLVRDGSSMHTFLKQARGAECAILAIETVDGEVFGAFTGSPWSAGPSYSGTGEAFLFRMKHSRAEKCWSVLDQAQMESEVDVYPFTGENDEIQFCMYDRLVVGGTGKIPTSDRLVRDGTLVNKHEWGFGLYIEGDLLYGTSSPCVTFSSPSLSKIHSDGSSFEIVNLELWMLTPCASERDAERLVLQKLFLEQHTRRT